jgi:mRNA-degrading endonuclease RelE of RelBE toxin-antitoxin system
MTWTVQLSKSGAKQLDKVPRDQLDLILKSLDEMTEDPFRGDVKPLKGAQWQGRYRKRIGRWRLIFVPHHTDHRVEVSAILRRSEKTYR